MNKKLLTIASIFALSSLTVLAEEAADTTVVAAPAPAATLLEEFASVEELSKLSLSVGFGYESQYVFRGLELSGSIVSPSVDLGYELSENVGLYLGYWGAYSVDQDAVQSQESDVYLGAVYTYEFVSLDLGYTAYSYVGSQNDTNEIKAVFTLDTAGLFADGFNFSPYVGLFYDFDFEDQFVTEFGISYSYSVTEWASLDLAYYLGYASYCSSSDADDYFYTGFSIDANIAINEVCGFSIGLRYAYNDQNGQEDQNNNIWFGSSLSFGF